jgi:lauroyl/myristoyl acyltransferase
MVAATVDNVHRGDGGVEVSIFGQRVSFAAWAAKIATRKSTPLVPTYYHSKDGRVRIRFGEALVTRDIEEAVQHYVSFFEKYILEDPASWAYLADRKWRRVLRQAASAIVSDNDGSAAQDPMR